MTCSFRAPYHAPALHELAIAESVIAAIQRRSSALRGRRVREVRIEIGRLSSVVPQAMELCFGAVARGTLVEGARLVILDVPGEGRCRRCGRTAIIASLADTCAAPGCDGFFDPVRGTELRLKDLVVD